MAPQLELVEKAPGPLPETLELVIKPQPETAFESSVGMHEPAVELPIELISEPIIDPLVIELLAELPELIFEPLMAPEEPAGGELDESKT
ncbi:hypothetical protein Nepgr_009479 [Nepenthes gracilis]|uniref:Uncharacterized protein n=1 Tax=Nepenthes gracilis TaxID=150966 RepID=A0AAD3SBD1_NEPGR|nr:hypothetical protein Nepgr_009479 [Nepenthes gracilis]